MNRIRTQATDRSPCHDSHHGFCCVCGMVWPCSWARRHAVEPAPTIPIPRHPTMQAGSSI